MRAIIVYWSVGLVSVSWLAGCGATRPCRSDCSQVARTATPATKVADTEDALSRALRLPRHGQITEDSTGLEPARTGNRADTMAPPAQKGAEPLVTRVKTLPEPGARPEMTPPGQIDGHPSPSSDGIVEVAPARIAENATGKNQPLPLKSEPIQTGATEKFKSLTGQVESYRRILRLRYAAVDQDDPYGGIVILDVDADSSQLREGQHVRVRGTLVAPETRTGSAHFRVQTIEILD